MYPDYGSDYVVINSGATFAIGADPVLASSGLTTYIQYYKVGFGATGAFGPVTSGNPLPVSFAGGITATISGFTGVFTVQGMVGGQAVPVSGTVSVTGISASPVFVQTPANCYVEVTGGIPLSRTRDSVSIFGPSGSTWAFVNLVNSSGSAIGISSNPLYTYIAGATFTVSINPTVGVTNDSAGNGLIIQGMSGGRAVSTTVGNTVYIYDTNILNGMTNISADIDALGVTLQAIYTALSVFGLVRPTSSYSGLSSITTSPSQIGGASGFTCAGGINFKSLGTNTDIIYLGSSTIGASYGYQLEPGENIFFNVGNINIVYAMARSGTQTLSYFAS